MRHRPLMGDITPFSAVHGFQGSSALRSALGAIQEIPLGLVHQDWLRMIVEECQVIGSTLETHWATEAEGRARRHGEQKPIAEFREGDLVLLHKPFWERGVGPILPQSDGPYRVVRLPTLHTAVLENP